MRIAFVSARLDCNDGVASHMELLAGELVRHGAELTMVTGLTTGETTAAGRYASLRQLIPRWHKLGDEKLGFSVPVIRKVAGVLRAGGFDVVHSHGLGLLPVIRAALFAAAAPIVASYHPSAHGNSAGDFRLGFSTRQRLAYRAFLRATRPDRVVALSRDTENLFVRECGLPRRQVVRIVAGVDQDHFRPPDAREWAQARASLGIAPGTMVCVLPGRLNLNKGHDVAVAAFQQLRAAHPGRSFVCLFPGGGAQEAEIAAMVASSGIPATFVMPGFVPDMRAMYWASDVVVLPSRNEGFALVVAEAMACGCAAIRTPSGGCADQIVEGVTGFAVPFNDPAALAHRIAALLDPSRLQAMRAAALAHAQAHFSGRRMGDETCELYAGLSGRRG